MKPLRGRKFLYSLALVLMAALFGWYHQYEMAQLNLLVAIWMRMP